MTIRQDMSARVALMRGVFIWGRKKTRKDLAQRTRRPPRPGRGNAGHREEEKGNRESARKREDEEVAFAGDDDGDGAAIGGDGKIAEAEAVKDGDGSRLRNGNFMICGNWRERGKVDPNEIAGFFVDSTLQDDARFIGRPSKDA